MRPSSRLAALVALALHLALPPALRPRSGRPAPYVAEAPLSPTAAAVAMLTANAVQNTSV